MASELLPTDPPGGGSVLTFPASTILAEAMPLQHLRPTLHLHLPDHTYVPKVTLPRSDWVSAVALPAFLAYRARYEGTGKGGTVGLIGTGAGLDALAAIEVLAPARVLVTDLHHDVVAEAVRNIQENLLEPHAVQVDGMVGSLGAPLLDGQETVDLIYENLPNLPLPDGFDLFSSHHSSHFVHASGGDVPATVIRDLLELHFLFLCQAPPLLNAGGHVLCAIACRRPLATLLAMPQQVGFDTRLLLYTWKIQADAQEAVQGYAAHQQRGGGPFHFYRIETLERAFGSCSRVTTAEQALDLEQALHAEAVDAAVALQLLEAGVPLGHTVAIIEASPRTDSRFLRI
jgi:methylase of polypeptide subunit release factors